MFDIISTWVYRIGFIISSLLILGAIWEKMLNYFGYTSSWINLGPARMLELSIVFMLVVIIFLLRQIRETQKK